MNQVVFLHGAPDFGVAQSNRREGRSDETLIEVAAVGICGSDLH
jgi:L-iditol 2-dehydrogenase